MLAQWAENKPPAGGAHSLPAQLFPADNWWNPDISGVSVDANSATMLAPYTGTMNYDWGNEYGLPWCTVSSDHAVYTFAGAEYADESDMTVEYPIPAAAHTVNGWTEELDRTLESNTFDGDRHFLCVDPVQNHLYEIYQVFYNNTASPVTFGGVPAGGSVPAFSYWAASVSFWDMNTNNVRPQDWTSSDAAGLQVLPGLVQYDEVVGSVPITHAHRMTFNGTVSTLHYWPATHHAASGGGVPLGARLRLKASFDITSIPGCNAEGQRLLQAYKTYGLIVADNGSNGRVTGMNDARWGEFNEPLRSQISACSAAITINTDMEIVTLGWSPPLSITTTTLAACTQSVPCTRTVYGTGGYNNYAWSKASGSYPTGMTLNVAATAALGQAVISGTPTVLETSNFTLHVEDAHVTPETDDQALSLTVNAAAGSFVTQRVGPAKLTGPARAQ